MLQTQYYHFIIVYAQLKENLIKDFHEDNRIVSTEAVYLEGNSPPSTTTTPLPHTQTSTQTSSTESPSDFSKLYKLCESNERLCFGLPKQCIQSKNCKILM